MAQSTYSSADEWRRYNRAVTNPDGGPADRRSGCVLAFLAIFSALQLVFLGANSTEAYRRIREVRVYKESTCTVLGTRIIEERGGRGGPSYAPEVAFEFPVDGRRQVVRGFGGDSRSGSRPATEARLAPYRIGSAYPCWYDPSDPTQAVLTRGFGRIAPYVIIPACMALVGLVLLVYTWSDTPLGRLGETVLGVAFSIPWIAFATGNLLEGSDLVIQSIVFGWCFGAVGIVILAATLMGLIPKMAARFTSPAKAPP